MAVSENQIGPLLVGVWMDWLVSGGDWQQHAVVCAVATLERRQLRMHGFDSA